MRAVRTTLIVLVLFTVTIIAWLALISYRLGQIRDRVYLLEAVSPGMTRQEVIIRLGKPAYSLWDDPRVSTEGEILVYKSWRRAHTDILVILDRHGRVVTTFHPDFHFPPVGGISAADYRSVR